MKLKKQYLETYTKEYSAEYQSQALIDLAKKLKKKDTKFKSNKKDRYLHKSSYTLCYWYWSK